MSVIVPVRLRESEVQMLKAVCPSDVRGDLNSGELFRLLLHREFNRRNGLPSPRPADYQSAFRVKPRVKR
jgi:hypothetical protein